MFCWLRRKKLQKKIKGKAKNKGRGNGKVQVENSKKGTSIASINVTESQYFYCNAIGH